MNSVPAAQSTNEDTALVFSAGNGNLVSISDVDAGAASVQVQLTVTNGTLTLSGVRRPHLRRRGQRHRHHDLHRHHRQLERGDGRHELRPHGQLHRRGHPHHRHQRPGQHRRRRPAHRHRRGEHHRQPGQRRAGRDDNTVTTNEDTPYVFAAADFGFSDPSDAPANSLFAVRIASCRAPARSRTMAQRSTPATCERRRHRARSVAVHAGGRRERRAIHELHLPGPGRRWHCRRRCRSRSNAEHDHD